MNTKSVLLIVLTFIFSQAETDEQKIDYYVNLITNAYKNGLTYELPTSANEYFSSKRREEYGTFDFVVIGAGSSGSVVANRLTEVENWNVLVLEAGQYGNNLTDIPNMYFPVQFTQYNWGYNSTPQKTACLGLVNRVCPYPRGKGVGGSTLINGLVYSRGHRSDFNKWGKLVGSKRWSYDTVLHYFKKSENFVYTDFEAPYDSQFHGEGGYLRVENFVSKSPQLNVFLDANREIGLDIVDYNANKLGASPSQINTIHGKRLDDGKAFLSSVKDRQNLKILTGSYVTKLRIDKEKDIVTGVEFSYNGNNYFVKAKKEVILSAGVFGSAQILMLSGIGPKNHLEEVGIDVVKDLQVGSTLRDHPTFYGLNFDTNCPEPNKTLRYSVKEYLNGRGQLAIPGNNQGVGFYESNYTRGTKIPDIEIMMIPSIATSTLSQRSFDLTDTTYEDVWKYANASRTFVMYVVALHTHSVGTVRLKNNNPYEYPLINSNFLSDYENKDINTLYEGIQLALKISKTKAFKTINTKLQGGPLRACKQHEYLSEDYWFCALRQFTVNLYHPVGTCPMGTDPRKGAVVNSELKVFGVKNLRVADASIFPFTLAGHPNAPAVMVGEQLGDIVKYEHGQGIDYTSL